MGSTQTHRLRAVRPGVQIWRLCLRRLRLGGRWWRRQDKRFGLKWRAANVALAVLMLVGVLLPLVQQIVLGNSYRLSADTLKLVGATDKSLTKQLTYDAQTQTYQFNKDAIQTDSANPISKLQQMQAQVGTASGQGKDKSLYALDVPQDFSKGVTYHDVNTNLSFGLVPEFSAAAGKQINGHLVFPLAGGSQAVYTLKNNGLKEDLVVPKTKASSLTFSYRLNLPKTLEARIIPGSDGAIGIYSADPTLFSNISYGSSQDQARVEKARENGDKTNLVFGLPSPIIKTVNGDQAGNAYFELNGNQLSVVASQLDDVQGPFTIDPSVVVTSTSDFQTGGNNDGNIDFSTSGQVTRGSLTGGTINGGWTTNSTSFTTGRSYASTVAYGGYLYILGGGGSSNMLSDVQYAPINSDGTIGTWQSTTSMATALMNFKAVAYNGYLYALGGQSYIPSGPNGAYYRPYSTVAYAPINSNGTIGTWQSTTMFTTPRSSLEAAVYNGYLYVLGGNSGNVYLTSGTQDGAELSDVQYAPLHADGTVGTWQTTTSLTSARDKFQSAVYDGNLYVLGGCTAVASNTTCSTTINTVQYAPINSDGTLGAWVNTNSFTTARFNQTVLIYNGYIYVAGGWNGTTYYSDVQYAPLNANGSVGIWRATSSFTTARLGMTGASANGYLYILGGYDGTTQYATTQYAPIDPAGMSGAYNTTTAMPAASKGYGLAYRGYLYQFVAFNASNAATTPVVYYAPLSSTGTVGTWATTTAYTTQRQNFAVVAYDGYMYTLGGSNGTTYYNTVYYSPIASNGTLGTWTATSAFTTARSGEGAVAYNGYLYISGGTNGSANYNDIQKAAIASNGTVGTWASAGTGFTTARTGLGMFVNGGNMYITGGRSSGTSYYADIQYAAISTSGSIGAWTTASAVLPYGMVSFSPVISNNCLYILQGWNGGGHYGAYTACFAASGDLGTFYPTLNFKVASVNGQTLSVWNGYLYAYGGQMASTSTTADVEYSPINNGGSGAAGSWQYTYNSASSSSFTGGFTNARYRFASIAYDGYLYILGGSNGTTYYNDVQYAPINANGTLGSWAATTSFSNARYGLNSIAYDGYLYILGGYDGTTYYNDVQYAAINTNGSLGSWQYTYNSASSSSFTGGFTTGRYAAAAATSGGYVYLLGGYASAGYQNDVQYAPLNTNGTIGTWASTNSFTTVRANEGAFTYGGYLYVLGGNNTGAYLNDVQYAPINTNGTVGTWANTSAFSAVRGIFAATAYNGFIYIMGGYNATYLSDVQYAPIDANGTLGAWQTSTSLSGARAYFGAAAANGNLYFLGGYNGTTYYNDVQYAPLSALARIGHYSKLLDLGTTANVTSISYNGVIPGGPVNVSYQAAGSSGVFGSSILASDALGSWGCLGNTTYTRYLFISVTLDDSYGQGTGGVFADGGGTNANLTDLTVNYNPVHPAPNIRLRTGQTMQSGVLSPLDTCSP